MNILVTGATGFIGTKLVESLCAKGCAVTMLVRDPSKVHSSKAKVIVDADQINASDKIDGIINLAGATINKRWTKSYKQELIHSRLQSTRCVLSVIKRLKQRPQVLISASAVGFYGGQGDLVVDEQTPANQTFTHWLCQQWESEALQAQNFGVRVCIARIGVVLGQGGALQQLLPFFKMGLGGKIGTGRQYFPWVHMDDVLASFHFFLEQKSQSGVFNITAPNPVRNQEFTKILGQQLRRPTFFTVPALMVKIVFGEMGQALLLDSIRAIPVQLQQAGFEFQYPQLDQALQQIVG